MTSPKQIADGLSETQRLALLEIPAKRYFKPSHTGFRWPTLAALKSKRLILALDPDFAGAGQNALHAISASGMHVRAYLMEQSQ